MTFFLVDLAHVAMSCFIGWSHLVVLGLMVSSYLDRIGWLPRKVQIGSIVNAAWGLLCTAIAKRYVHSLLMVILSQRNHHIACGTVVILTLVPNLIPVLQSLHVLEIIQGLCQIMLSGSTLVSCCLLVSDYPMRRLDIRRYDCAKVLVIATFILQNHSRGELPSSLSGIMLCMSIAVWSA
jgi:hypothetical protein